MIVSIKAGVFVHFKDTWRLFLSHILVKKTEMCLLNVNMG